jgi:hypothetical protein
MLSFANLHINQLLFLFFIQILNNFYIKEQYTFILTKLLNFEFFFFLFLDLFLSKLFILLVNFLDLSTIFYCSKSSQPFSLLCYRNFSLGFFFKELSLLYLIFNFLYTTLFNFTILFFELFLILFHSFNFLLLR